MSYKFGNTDRTAMMNRDYYNDGMRDGRGDRWRNGSEECPESEYDKYNYQIGHEDGERRRRLRDEEEEYH